VDTATANDYNEIEILGTDGNYYIHITSWDNEEDIVEAEIINKITLSNNATGEDGSRGTPSIPAWNSGNWIELGSDNNDATTDAVDILNADSGSLTDNLMYYDDGSEFMYFMYFLEADPDAGSYTYADLMEDGANDGDYDFVISSYGSTGLRLYSWDSVFSEWSVSQAYGSGYFRFETTDNQEHVAFTVPYSDAFTPVDDDFFKGITSDAGLREFQTGDWFNVRNPTPANSVGDFTTAASSIPEFSTLLMPMASVLLIVGNRVRRKTNDQH